LLKGLFAGNNKEKRSQDEQLIIFIILVFILDEEFDELISQINYPKLKIEYLFLIFSIYNYVLLIRLGKSINYT